MANIVLNENINNFENEDNDDIDTDINDIYEYKGYFLENNIDEEEDEKFYEFGAHFPYLFLYQKLEILAQMRKEEEENLKEKNNSMKENNENNIKEETDIFSFFNKKDNNKKSRNRNNNYDNFTNQPFANKNIYNNNKINFNNSGNIKNYIPKSNYIKKKSKMTIETSTKNSIYSNFQKRSNSSIDDDEKNSIYSNSEKNSYLYTKNINLSSSSSKQYVNVKNNFNTIQNKSNNLILQSHLKNSSVFTSNFHTLYKPKYQSKSPKFKLINAMNKFSFPSQGNSRKNSIEKDIMMNNMFFNIQKACKINVNDNKIKSELENTEYNKKCNIF